MKRGREMEQSCTRIGMEGCGTKYKKIPGKLVSFHGGLAIPSPHAKLYQTGFRMPLQHQTGRTSGRTTYPLPPGRRGRISPN